MPSSETIVPAANMPTATAAPRIIVARAPTRIDFGGGWTDVPPYSDREGGYVCNAAINRYATARVRAATAAEPGALDDPPGAESALAAAAMQRTQREHASDPLSLHLASDFPLGAGLGGSSAAGVASLGALLAWRGVPCERREIAELSRTVEVEDLGIAGGRQDHYAAAYGGVLGLEFGDGGVTVDRIELQAHVMEELERRAVLVYTGQSRISGETISAVLNGYQSGVPDVCAALARMRELAVEMSSALKRASIDDLAALVSEHWVHQRSLHPGIATAEIDHIMSIAAKAGAGGKAMGASGGGCVLLISRAGYEESLRTAVSAAVEVLPFRIDTSGLVVSEAQQ